MLPDTSAERATRAVAEAAAEAAKKVAEAAALAVSIAAAASASQASAMQVLSAVAISRLDGLDKKIDAHDKLDLDRFAVIGGWLKSIFIAVLVALGTLVFYLITKIH